jgi:hypothetical protein
MWFDPASTENPMNLRHDAQQGDRLERHGWLAHDGKTYGRQLIEDGEVHMNITMVGACDGITLGWFIMYCTLPAARG